MGLFEEIEKRGNVFKPKRATIDMFDEITQKMDRGRNREYVMYGSADTNGYLTAVLNKDEHAIEMYQIKFTTQAFRNLKALHERIQRLGDTMYDVFCELERRFDRTNDHQLTWNSRMVMTANEHLEPADMMIRLDSNTNTFTMFINQYSECGWEHARTEFWIRVKPEELFDKINMK